MASTLEDKSVMDSLRVVTGLTTLSSVISSGKNYLMSAAIDIGTSSCCYAFSYVSSPNDIRMNKNWAGIDTCQSFKTPTSILTSPGPDGQLLAFGYEAEEKYRTLLEDDRGHECNLFSNFKMELYRHTDICKKDLMVKSKFNKSERSLFDLYVMTLEYLRKHMLHQIKLTGVTTLNPEEVRWVLCVPATWTDEAKDFIRHAAYKANLIPDVQSSQLLLLLEATAAALYCTRKETLFTREHMNTDGATEVGTTYLVIDAGAGTVDYTAQKVLPKGETEEIMIPSGGDWGGGHVNERFDQLLEEVFGKDTMDEFAKSNPLAMYYMGQKFELTKAKADEQLNSLNIQMPIGIERFINARGPKISEVINSNTEKHGVTESNGNLKISNKKMRELFDPSINEICSKVQQDIEQNELDDLDWIFLVGGFGTCKLLHTPLIKLFQEDRIAIPVDAQTAVVKGAVLYGHNPNILIRVAKKTYGVSTYSSYNPRKHQASKKSSMGASAMCADLFLPFVQMGDTLPSGVHGEMIASPVVAKAISITVDLFCIDRRTAPNEILYVDSKDVKKVGTIRVPMPNTEGGLSREVSLKFAFKDEIQIVAFDKSSGKSTKKEFTWEFDYDMQK